jgi:hypothetical protein
VYVVFRFHGKRHKERQQQLQRLIFREQGLCLRLFGKLQRLFL